MACCAGQRRDAKKDAQTAEAKDAVSADAKVGHSDVETAASWAVKTDNFAVVLWGGRRVLAKVDWMDETGAGTTERGEAARMEEKKAGQAAE